MTKLKQNMPHLTVARVAPSPVAGLYRVEVREKGAVFYVTEDASHLVAGDLYALTGSGLVNVTEVRRESKRRKLLASVPFADQIVFDPVGPSQATVSVFTDVDCSYCRRFHQHIGELNGYGIEVRYLAYPRAGRDSNTYKKMVWAWCADDRRQALTALKAGDDIPPASCLPAPATPTPCPIRALLAILPPKQRETFRLRVVEDYTLGEIADALHVPLGTVKSRLTIAVRHLRHSARAYRLLH